MIARMKRKKDTVNTSKTHPVSDVSDMLQFIIANMATKEDIANMATKDDIVNMATKDDIVNTATKDDVADLRERIVSLEHGQAEILDIVRPLSRAHSLDSVTLVSHGKRLTRIEKHLQLNSR